MVGRVGKSEGLKAGGTESRNGRRSEGERVRRLSVRDIERLITRTRAGITERLSHLNSQPLHTARHINYPIFQKLRVAYISADAVLERRHFI